MYFFTATILNWQHLLQNDTCKQIIVDQWQRMTDEERISVYVFVIMPNHYHVIWSIHEDHDPEAIQRDFHKWTSNKLLAHIRSEEPDILNNYRVRHADREFQVWKRNPLAIELYSEKVMWQKLDYIHNNPCTARWKLSPFPQAYRFSSARFYLDNYKDWDFLTHIMDA